MLEEQKPDRLLTIGADADVASIASLNHHLEGGLTVLWIDAHGDLNAPEESRSHLFYGMPLRALLGDCAAFRSLISSPLESHQIIHSGGRDLEETRDR